MLIKLVMMWKAVRRRLRSIHLVLNAANLIEEDSSKMQEHNSSSSLNIELKVQLPRNKKKTRKVTMVWKKRSSPESKDSKDNREVGNSLIK